MQGRLLLDVVIAQSSAVFQLLSREDEPLLLRRDPLFVLDLGFNILDGVIRFDVQSDRLSRQRLHEDLHCHVIQRLNKQVTVTLTVVSLERMLQRCSSLSLFF